jgi:regulator of replication initiation timing
MEAEIQNLTNKASELEKSLSEEKDSSSAARSENVSLRSELAALHSELSQVSSTLVAERDESTSFFVHVSMHLIHCFVFMISFKFTTHLYKFV